MNTFKKLLGFSRNESWLRFLALVTLGTMILFFLGCGSDNKPGGTVSGKNQNAAKSGSKGSKAAISALTGNVPGTTQREAPSDNVEVLPGMTRAQLNARMAADQKKYEASRNTGEVFPGMKMTEAELEAKMAADQKKYDASKDTAEDVPGLKMTAAEVRAKMAAEQEKFEAFKNKGEAVPGLKMTEAEVRAKMAAEKKMHEAQN